MVGKTWWQEMRQLVASHPQSRRRKGLQLSAAFLLLPFVSSHGSACGNPTVFRVGSPASLKTFLEILSLTWLEVSLLGDPKSNQIDREVNDHSGEVEG